jgi:hypothetical protein
LISTPVAFAELECRIIESLQRSIEFSHLTNQYSYRFSREEGAHTFNEVVKSENLRWCCRKFELGRANLSGVRRTYLRRNDFEMQRNADIGLFAKPSGFRLFPVSSRFRSTITLP